MHQRVLLPLDGSKMAEQALPAAVAQAERFGAELVLLRVLEPFPHLRGMSATDLDTIRRQTAIWTQEYFDRITADLGDCDVAVTTATAEGRAAMTILQYAEENDVDLIVLCSRGRSGLSRWLLGSVADRVIRGASVAVLLIKAQKTEETEEP